VNMKLENKKGDEKEKALRGWEERRGLTW
jgi:hypothetical protein